MGELRVDLARVHRAARPHEVEDRLFTLAAATCQAARVHEPGHFARHETVVDEDILFDAERVVEAFEVAGAISGDAVPQSQVLRAGGRANRVGLHEAERVQGARKRGRRKETAGDGEATEVGEGECQMSCGLQAARSILLQG